MSAITVLGMLSLTYKPDVRWKESGYIRQSVESLCRDGANAQYMHYLSKSRITLPQTR